MFNAGMGTQTAFSVNVLIDEHDWDRARQIVEEDNEGFLSAELPEDE